jgi:hypothetical protein
MLLQFPILSCHHLPNLKPSYPLNNLTAAINTAVLMHDASPTPVPRVSSYVT